MFSSRPDPNRILEVGCPRSVCVNVSALALSKLSIFGMIFILTAMLSTMYTERIVVRLIYEFEFGNFPSYISRKIRSTFRPTSPFAMGFICWEIKFFISHIKSVPKISRAFIYAWGLFLPKIFFSAHILNQQALATQKLDTHISFLYNQSFYHFQPCLLALFPIATRIKMNRRRATSLQCKRDSLAFSMSTLISQHLIRSESASEAMDLL